MFTTYYPNGQCRIEEDRANGLRVYGVRIFDVTGQLISIMDYNDGRIYIIDYYPNIHPHNLHGPASISWYDNGQICDISYYQNGIRHAIHFPDYMRWYYGQLSCISYRQNGSYHNLQGPAFIQWSSGQIERIKYYHFGELIKVYYF